MKKKGKKNNKNEKYFKPLLYVSILLIAAIFALCVGLLRQSDIVSKYELLEKIDNQACRYLAGQSAVNGSFNLNVNAKNNEPKLIYKCTIGQATAAREIQGKSIGGYALGATVMYFATNEEAEKYAEEKINPLRFWGGN